MGMTEPLFIEPIFQKDRGDCAVCCLVMLLGKTYPEIVKATSPKTIRQGMTGVQMIETAAKFGVLLQAARAFDRHEDTGILTVLKAHIRKPKDTHAVLLIRGVVIDPVDGRVWPDVDVFLQAEGYRLGTLLRRA